MRGLFKIDVNINKNIKVDDELSFLFKYDDAILIFPLEDIPFYRKNYISDKKISKRFNNMIVEGKFKYFSRVDGNPVFDIDVSITKYRNNKINEILNG